MANGDQASMTKAASAVPQHIESNNLIWKSTDFLPYNQLFHVNLSKISRNTMSIKYQSFKLSIYSRSAWHNASRI